MLKTRMSGEVQEERGLFYQFFLHYYKGDLLQLTVGDWQNLVQLLKKQPNIKQNSYFNKAIQMLEEIDEEKLTTFPFDYNRLFVGPNRLLASPYESSYENIEGSLMQTETLNVRNFYYHEGLQVAEEGRFPDDHIQFELEFMVHLLGFRNEEEKRDIEELFLQKHLLKWCPKHCERIAQNSQNEITLAMGLLLQGFLQFEKWLLEGGDNDEC
jgi:putative dimethyl sulfoxide reductase chaperone